MQYWKNLGLFQKLIIGTLVLAMVVVMPELLPLLDMGGIELIFGFIVLNVKHIRYWLHAKGMQISGAFSTLVASFVNSAIAKPKTFVYHAIICSFVLCFTGSLTLSISFLFPVLLANGILI